VAPEPAKGGKFSRQLTANHRGRREEPGKKGGGGGVADERGTGKKVGKGLVQELSR